LPSSPLAWFTWFDTVRRSEMPSMKMRWAPIWAAASRRRLSGERSSWLSTCGLVKMSFSWFCCCKLSRSQPKAAGGVVEPELAHSTQALPRGVFCFRQLHPVSWAPQEERGDVLMDPGREMPDGGIGAGDRGRGEALRRRRSSVGGSRNIAASPLLHKGLSHRHIPRPSLIMTRALGIEVQETGEVPLFGLLDAVGLAGDVRPAIALGQGRETHARVPCDTRGHVMPKILHRYHLPWCHRCLSMFAPDSTTWRMPPYRWALGPRRRLHTAQVDLFDGFAP
jgi:hypothetical protein